MFDDKDFENVTDVKKEEIPVSDLDQALKDVTQLTIRYKAAKEASSNANSELERAKVKLISLLERAGKQRWEVDGYGGFSMYNELKYRVPSDIDGKKALLEFLKSDKVQELTGNDPMDTFYSTATVNSQTLNRFCKELTAMAAEQGETLTIPGIAAPKSEPKLRALPKKK